VVIDHPCSQLPFCFQELAVATPIAERGAGVPDIAAYFVFRLPRRRAGRCGVLFRGRLPEKQFAAAQRIIRIRKRKSSKRFCTCFVAG
jgi:hypothetical protein